MEKMLNTVNIGVLNKLKLQILLLMKRILIVSIIFFSISVGAFSQRITIKLGNVKLSKVLKEIRKEAKVDFFYSDKELDVDKIVSGNFENEELLNIVSKLVGANFKVQLTEEGVVLITPVVGKINTVQETIIVKGNVTNANKEVLPGVTVIIAGTKLGVSTDLDGNYIIRTKKDAVLEFSFLGYKKKSIQVKDRVLINVVLEQDVSKLDEVVITGIVDRDKKSFTGAVKSVKGTELRAVGNSNIIQSLKTLDPSFMVINNNTLGSNPNILPQIQVRGQTSITTEGLADEFGGDPNQPLFVLDGFETTLRTIVDLDMNRVASITILKDAASTALYGAKSANGVVVVETIKPKPGKLRVNYTLDFRVETPDLSGYNLMNSKEKLEFERLSGRWSAPSYSPEKQYELDIQYNSILAEINRGVDTYWLREPLQVGYTTGNSLYVDGGSENLTFGIGLNYKNQQGVMIGSDRETWGANVFLNYRKDKLNISNNLYVNGYESNNSHFGSFSSFAQANPYYRRRDENGDITRYLDTDTNVGSFYDFDVINPLYNSTLNSIDRTTNFSIQNNLRAIYTFSNNLRVQTNLQISKGIKTGVTFLPSEHSSFINTELFRKGSYVNARTDNFSYRINSMLSYSKLFNEDHNLNVNLRGEIEETTNKRLTISAVGFPSGTNGNPAFAYGYTPDESPSTASNVYRRVNVLGSVNYTYKRKYLFDATYRLDGSTTFGKNEKFSPFWAVGIGWNINNEFDMDPDQVQLFKIRANIGSTGNQGFGSLSSTSIYGFNQNVNIFGQGVYLTTLSNPNLKWQKTLNTSLGFDGVFFNRRLTTTVNIYSKNTDPLVVAVDLPSSTGVYEYPINTGNLVSNGAEVILKYSPIYRIKDRIIWTLGYNANYVTTKFNGFNNSLKSLNDAQLSSRTLQRFRDGFSPDDLWAVPSLGIDPASGKEVFLTKDGEQTFEYDADNEVVMGSVRPDVEGVISSNLRIKNFSFGLNIRYRFGGERFNNALYDKVENISNQGITLNQDRRALYDRWQNPGDVSKFKAISLTDETPISSRFIQKENELIGESINFGYDFSTSKWVESIGFSTLRFTAYMSDIFRLSTIRAERGTAYPFARAISFSLNASF